MTPSHFIFSSTFMLGITGLAFYRTHMISALLCLDTMMLSLYVALSLWALQFESLVFSAAPMFLLAFSACEASAGLALVVAVSRTHGSDQLNTLSLLQC